MAVFKQCCPNLCHGFGVCPLCKNTGYVDSGFGIVLDVLNRHENLPKPVADIDDNPCIERGRD